MWDAATIAQIVSAGAAVVPGFFFMWRGIRKRFDQAKIDRAARWSAIEQKIDDNTAAVLRTFKEHERLDQRREDIRDRQHRANLQQIGQLKLAIVRLDPKANVNGS